MSVRVPPWFPPLPRDESHYIGHPFTVGLADGYVQRLAQLVGGQLPLVHMQVFGSTEGSTGTYRFLHKASYNARALLFYFIPIGRPTGSSDGTITVAGADAPTAHHVAQQTAGIGDLGDLEEQHVFRKEVTPDTIAEHTYAVSNVRLHSVVVYEIPRQRLSVDLVATDTHHLDQSFSWPDRKFTDDVVDAGRGYKELLTVLNDARTTLRRHWSFGYLTGVTINPALNNTWTTIYENLTYRGRNLGSAADPDEARFRFFGYVGARSAGAWDIRIRDATTTDTAAITGINATGWWDPTGNGVPAALSDGAAFQMQASAVDSGLVIEGQRTAGAAGDTMRLDFPQLIEDLD